MLPNELGVLYEFQHMIIRTIGEGVSDGLDIHPLDPQDFQSSLSIIEMGTRRNVSKTTGEKADEANDELFTVCGDGSALRGCRM